jgi:hypothetical protein
LYGKIYSTLIASLIFLSTIVTPALGVSLRCSAGDGDTAMTSSGNYKLDKTTALKEETVISMDNIYYERQACGSGKNSIDNLVSGNDRTIDNRIQSSGILTTSSAATASGEGVAMSQNILGSGDAIVSVLGQDGSSSVVQEAGVEDGYISSSQSISSGAGVASSQKTKMQGEAGAIGSSSESSENMAMARGYFLGNNRLEADLASAAEKAARTSGRASISDVEMIDDESQNIISSGDMAMSVDGLSLNIGWDLGKFGFKATNVKKPSPDICVSAKNLPAKSVASPLGGRPEACLLTGWRWNSANPQIRWYLRDDSYLMDEGLTAESVANAITAASNTWDANSNQNLFADVDTVTVSTTVKADAKDGKNTQSFRPLSSGWTGALAYSRIWYSYAKVDGRYSATESDISYNTQYSWSTSGTSNYDVQTVALHEMGHTLGLADLYGKAAYKGDTDQIMHRYTGVKRSLGNGDKNGLWTLYG